MAYFILDIHVLCVWWERTCYVVIGVGEVGCGTHTRSTSTTQDAYTRGPADAGWRLTDSARPGRDRSAPRGGRSNYLSLHVNHRPTVFLCSLRMCCIFLILIRTRCCTPGNEINTDFILCTVYCTDEFVLNRFFFIISPCTIHPNNNFHFKISNINLTLIIVSNQNYVLIHILLKKLFFTKLL